MVNLSGKHLGSWCASRRNMEVEAQITRALRRGTTAMRSMGTVFLPMDERERQNPSDYYLRLARSFLHSGYADSVTAVAGRPFQRPVELREDDMLPVELQPLEYDCDRQGTNLTRFAAQVFTDIVDRGIGMVLVDMPPTDVQVTPETETEPAVYRRASMADAATLDLRPYFCRVHPDSIINWAWKQDATGKQELDFVVIASERSETNPETLQETAVQCLLYYSRDEWQRWEREAPPSQASAKPVVSQMDLLQTAKQSGAQTEATSQTPYFLVEQGANPLGVVPLVWANISPRDDTGDQLASRPPMIDLAWANIDHWQSYSQQENTLYWSRVPLITGSGLSQQQVEEGVTLGAGAQMLSTSPDFAMNFVETTGAALEAGWKHLGGLEQRMASLGMAPMLTVAGAKTATGEAIDEQRTQAEAQSWAEQLEWMLYRAYEMAALWIGQPLPDEFDVKVFRDFGLVARTAQDMQILDTARARKDISLETYLRELQKRAVIDPELDIEEEIARIDDAGPDLSGLLMPPQPPVPSGKQQPQPDAPDLPEKAKEDAPTPEDVAAA